MKYLLLILLLLLTSCDEFQTKIDMMKSEQMTCAEADESLCAGWKVDI